MQYTADLNILYVYISHVSESCAVVTMIKLIYERKYLQTHRS